MKKGIETYLSLLQTEKLACENTVKAYGADLNQFQTWLDGRNKRSWDEVTSKDIEEFLAELLKTKKEATVARKLSVIKSFFNFLVTEKVVEVDHADLVRAITVTKHEPVTATKEEFGALIATLEERYNSEARRNKVMLLLMRHMGLEVSEVVGLDVADIALERDPITVRVTRRSVDQELPVPTLVVDPLKQYIFHVRPKLVRNRREQGLFLNRRGERLTRQGIWLISKTLARQAQIDPKRVSARVLRNTCAQSWLQNGKPLEEVQQLLGHAVPATTERYLVPA